MKTKIKRFMKQFAIVKVEHSEKSMPSFPYDYLSIYILGIRIYFKCLKSPKHFQCLDQDE
jgi:hypothetical protein